MSSVASNTLYGDLVPRPRQDEPEDPRILEIIYGNRERIASVENELDRVRERSHRHESDIAVIRYLAEKVEAQGEAILEHTKAIDNLAEGTIHRPRQSTLQLVVNAIIALTAIAALIVAIMAH